MYHLRELRIQKGLTQAELSKTLQVSASSIGMYEQGRREPDNETLGRIANFFNVTTDYLLGRTDEPGDTVGFRKGLLGDINGDSPLAQKAREAMATQEVRNTNPELASITPAELALIHAYRNASSDIKRVVSSALQPRKVVAPDEQYRQIDEFFQLCNVNFYYARCDHNGMTEGDYVLLSQYPIKEAAGRAKIEDAPSFTHACSLISLYEKLLPAMTSSGHDREKLLQDFINETFALDIAIDTGTPYISKNITMGLPKEAAEKHIQKHIQKRIAELTADQSPEDDNHQPKPTKSKRA